MTIGAYNAVRVGDLEVAMVLARELRPVAGRQSLTLGQLQHAFGVSRLDGPGRERIDAALAAAGMQADPSVLEAHPDEPLAFAFAGGGGPAPNGLARRRFARTAAESGLPGRLPVKPAAPEARTESRAEPAAAPVEPEAAAGAPALPVAAILAGIAVPVVLASVIGWRFGVAFAGFGAVAAGFLLARPDPGVLLRSGRTFLLAVAGLSLLSLLSALALAGAGR